MWRTAPQGPGERRREGGREGGRKGGREGSFGMKKDEGGREGRRRRTERLKEEEGEAGCEEKNVHFNGDGQGVEETAAGPLVGGKGVMRREGEGGRKGE